MFRKQLPKFTFNLMMFSAFCLLFLFSFCMVAHAEEPPPESSSAVSESIPASAESTPDVPEPSPEPLPGASSVSPEPVPVDPDTALEPTQTAPEGNILDSGPVPEIDLSQVELYQRQTIDELATLNAQIKFICLVSAVILFAMVFIFLWWLFAKVFFGGV